MLIDAGCEVRGDDAVQRVDNRVKPASDEDWDTEYEDAIIAARVVGPILGRDPVSLLAPPYYDDSTIRSDLAAAGFANLRVERVTEPSRAASAYLCCTAPACAAAPRRSCATPSTSRCRRTP